MMSTLLVFHTKVKIKKNFFKLFCTILGEVEKLEEMLEEETGSVQVDNVDTEKDSKLKRLEEKDKRKKFVRLLCPHCRVECATFRVK